MTIIGDQDVLKLQVSRVCPQALCYTGRQCYLSANIRVLIQSQQRSLMKALLKNDKAKGYIKLGLLFGHLVVFELLNETEQVAIKVIVKHKIEKFFILKRKT